MCPKIIRAHIQTHTPDSTAQPSSPLQVIHTLPSNHLLIYLWRAVDRYLDTLIPFWNLCKFMVRKVPFNSQSMLDAQ